MSTESMVTQAALEPCPFCRGQAEWASRKPYLVHCVNPDCLGHHYEQDEQGGYNHSFYTEAEAIAAWNTRTAAQPEREVVGDEQSPCETTADMVVRLRDMLGPDTDFDNYGFSIKRGNLRRLLAALTTPAPAVSRDEIVAVLRGAIGALEQDYEAGCESGDSDWEGLAYQRLEATRAILSRIQQGAEQ